MTPSERAAWLEKQKMCRKMLRASPGYVRNPLRDYGRNEPCLCGRLDENMKPVKWKKCCMGSMPLFIPKDELDEHMKVLRGEA